MLLTFGMFAYANLVLYFYNNAVNIRQKKIFKFLLIIGFVLVLGLRDLNGLYSDEYNYRKDVIELIGQPLVLSNVFKLEGGFYLLQWLSAFFFKSDQVFIFLTSAIIYSLLFNSFFKYGRDFNYHLIFSFFILSGNLMQSTNIIRQYLAFSIVLYGFRYALDGNNKKFFLFLVLGMWFHTSFLITIPFMYILLSPKINTKHVIFLLALLIVIPNIDSILPQLLSDSIYSDYLQTLGQNMSIIRAMFWIFQYVLFIGVYVWKNKKNICIYYINAAIIAIGLNITSVFFLYASRLTVMFENIAIIGLAYILSIIKKEQRIIICFIWILAYICFAYFQTKGVPPYKLFF